MELQQRVLASFERQGLMKTLGAKVIAVEKGRVVLECPWSEKVTQQDGFFHAGALASVVDSACGYAAMTLMPEGKEVLSVEFKVNMLRPANTEKIIAVGEVVRVGRTITVVEGIVWDAKQEKKLVKLVGTMISTSK